MEDIKRRLESIILLEKKLLLDDNRSDSDFLKEIISIDFIEYGSSGKKHKYCSGDTYPPIFRKVQIIENSIEIKELSEKIILVLYQTKNNETQQITNRSSIWKNENKNCWKLVFHQGTKVD